jgi:hypothetical protein
MGDIADLTRTGLTGDIEGAKAAVRSAERHIRTTKQTGEG